MPTNLKSLQTICLCALLALFAFAAQVNSQTLGVAEAVLLPGGMEDVLQSYRADQDNLRFKYSVPMSPVRHERFLKFYQEQIGQLTEIDFSGLKQDGKVDYLLFKNELQKQIFQLELDQKKDQQIEELVPFWQTVVTLSEAKEAGEKIDGKKTAETLQQLVEEVADLTARISQGSLSATEATNAIRAGRRVSELRRSLDQWFQYYHGYDPLFSWWCKAPFEKADSALRSYSTLIRSKLAKIDASNKSAIIGEPIGNEALIQALKFEMIPYTPAELIQIANREFEWCDKEMAKAAKELGFDDWRAAQDTVKDLYVQPGEQPMLIREMANEATEFVESRKLVTVPPLCKETWRMRMMSPERQKVSPYFLGGNTILVSYPTDAMDHSDKLMSLRGNNPHFSRAVVHHELIPGHHLQGFMRDRYRTHRSPFATPFWLEGWALYWEMRLWDLEFARSPEDRIGMLFWRKHRCARIIFSLSYHLNEMSPEECIDFLVERVGHERNNATGEVRRSVQGGYGPLYQAAYMLGGLQIRAMYKELVETGKIPERDFHDAILQQNSIPIEMIRARFTNQKLAPDFKTNWRFAD
jgi:uncharacterized protein (DUF885 family)